MRSVAWKALPREDHSHLWRALEALGARLRRIWGGALVKNQIHVHRHL